MQYLRSYSMISLILLAVFTLLTYHSFAQTYQTSGNGTNWNNANSWVSPPGIPPNPLPGGDSIIIAHDITLSYNYRVNANGVLIVNSNAVLNGNIKEVSNYGTIINNGTFNNMDELENYNIVQNNGLAATRSDFINEPGGELTNALGATLNVCGHLQNEEFNNEVCNSIVTNHGIINVGQDIRNSGVIKGSGTFNVNGMVENYEDCSEIIETLTFYICESPHEIHNDGGYVASTVEELSCTPSPINCSTEVFIALLPIELLSFQAHKMGKHVELSWITSFETNNDYFTVEKSKDGRSFEQVVIIDGAGNSNINIEYSASDYHPYLGVSHYRLKQTDFDGKYKYSHLIAVQYETEMEINIFPNPSAGDKFYLSMNGEGDEEVLVELYNQLGNIVYSKSIVQERGSSSIATIDIQNRLSSGIYHLVLSNRNEMFHRKLIIK